MQGLRHVSGHKVESWFGDMSMWAYKQGIIKVPYYISRVSDAGELHKEKISPTGKTGFLLKSNHNLLEPGVRNDPGPGLKDLPEIYML